MSAVEDTNHERRITFCLYDCWEKIAGTSGLPSLKNIDRNEIEPFRDNLVLIDLRRGQDNATFQVIGNDLQLDLTDSLLGKPIKDVPGRTMLSRVTDHYLEVLANRVPIAFEAEFVNSQGEKALYRGILLPFSDDKNSINFILGGVRWMLAKDVTLDEDKPSIEELMRTIAEGHKDNVLELEEDIDDAPEEIVATETAETDTPPEAIVDKVEINQEDDYHEIDEGVSFEDEIIDQLTAGEENNQDIEPQGEEILEEQIPQDDISASAPADEAVKDEPVKMDALGNDISMSPLAEPEQEPEQQEIEEEPEAPMEEAAAELTKAQLATALKKILKYIKKEDANHNRSRDSLYNILTAIYQFHQTCEASSRSFEMLVNDHGLKIQARAPFTPVLKVCLGKNYDKTRLTEYAAALGIGKYMNVEVEEFHNFIKNFPGGIKGCVKEMRAIRKAGGTEKASLKKSRTSEEAREILSSIDPLGSFHLKKIIVSKKADEFCLLLAKRNGNYIDVLKILDDKYTKLDPILKRAAFIKGNLKKGK